MRSGWPGFAVWILALALAAPALALSDNAATQLERARDALLESDGIAAEAYLRKAMAAGATPEQVAARMGEALIDQGNLIKAREWLATGRFAKGEEAHGFRMLGLLERLQGQLPASGRAYDQALKFAPRDSMLWVDIGRLRYAGGEQLQAIEAADRALVLDPENLRALEFRAQLVRDQFGLEAALPWFERGLQQAPDDLPMLGGYAATLGELGRAKEMLVITRKMLEVQPGHPQALYLQAVLAARAGRNDVARSLMNRTKGKLRGLAAGLMLEGGLELRAGNTNLAIELLDRLARKQPGNARAQQLLARALYDGGQFLQLVNRFSAAAARPDATTYLLQLVARAQEELGNRAAAGPLLDRAAAASIPAVMPIAEPDPIGVLALRWRDMPTLPSTAVPYVRSLLAARQTAEAEAIAERLRQLNAGSGDAQSLAGDVQLAQGRGAAALERYMLAARIRYPDTLLLRTTEALHLARRGNEVAPLIAGYLTHYPASVLAARMAANGAAMDGDWERCRLLLENLRQRGAVRDARLLADLSLAQIRLGDPGAAAESGARAYQLQRGSPVAAQAYGMALVAQGERLELAEQLLRKAQLIGGDNSLLAESRAQLAKRRKV